MELTEKQKWFFVELAKDMNPVRAARKVGLSQREYDVLVNGEEYRPHIQEASRKHVESAGLAPAKARPSEIDPTKVTRESVNTELIQIMEDLKGGTISPGEATASVGVIKALAQVNGLITTDVNINTNKKLEDMSTEELYSILRERDVKLIDATPGAGNE